MIGLKYSLVIEATEDPVFSCFYSPDLPGFSGVCSSVEDCIYKAKWGIEEFLQVLRSDGLSVPKPCANPQITILDAVEDLVLATA